MASIPQYIYQYPSQYEIRAGEMKRDLNISHDVPSEFWLQRDLGFTFALIPGIHYPSSGHRTVTSPPPNKK